jgi:hypothetical protein
MESPYRNPAVADVVMTAESLAYEAAASLYNNYLFSVSVAGDDKREGGWTRCALPVGREKASRREKATASRAGWRLNEGVSSAPFIL